ncbi:MAG: alpha-galactosidase, partial [Faecalibacterium sp.]
MKHKAIIEQIGTLYALHTARTSYLFRVMPSGQLEHLHYGAAVACSKHTEAALAAKPAFSPGCSVQYAPEFAAVCLEQMRTEVGTLGKGDIGEPLLDVHFADGSNTLDFHFVGAVRCDKPSLDALPSAYGADATLAISLAEQHNPALTLTLYYSVFVENDIITRTAVLHNNTAEPVVLHRFGSSQLDFNDTDFIFSTFHGGWSDEMHRCDTRLNGGTALCESRGGASSNHTNPFTMLSRPGTTETAGEVYGSNLIYSGNHRTIAAIGAYGKLRLQTGISPEGFAFTLSPGEEFSAPEAVLSYTDGGYDALSQNMHAFVREHVVRGKWQHAPRPVLLNSWEACYMDFNEAKLLKLARAGKACGVELFVLDDGWFGTRSDDKQSLGDWYVNTKKLPRGLKGLAEKINALDMQFGVWVEPEMVNVNSDLYRAHPDWVLCHPSRPHSEGRNQRILDLTNPAVRTYLKETLSAIFASANLSYVKWDMNRVMSDAFSQYLPAAQQGEVAHRYILGLYEVLDHLTKT